MTTLIVLLAFAVLFAMFAFVKHRPDCGSDCGGCSKTCDLKEWKHENEGH